MSYEEFERKIETLGNLDMIGHVLEWDKEVMMPEKGISARSKQQSVLSRLQHEKITSDGLGTLIESLDESDLTRDQLSNLREVRRQRKRSIEVPPELVEEISDKRSETVEVWKEAKKSEDFEMFAEKLEELVELKREYAREIDSDKEPYKVLFRDFEPYLDFERVKNIIEELKSELVPILEKIRDQGEDIDGSALEGDFDEKKTIELNREIVDFLGLGDEIIRLDTSAHPFTQANAFEARITTAINRESLAPSLMATIHESGHALYQLGLPKKHYGLPRGTSRELSIHESQSKLWEDHIGRSESFWKLVSPKIKDSFPEKLDGVGAEDMYSAVNRVKTQNMIRVNADELTYHLHIALRFEIERKLVNGEIEVRDLEEIWNKKMEEYLGLVPEKPSEGVLQDIHWAYGSFGYFPTYSIGSVISSQLFDALREDLGDVDAMVESGDFDDIVSWLGDEIHSHGQLYKTGELIERATGDRPKPDHFLDYIRRKYGEIYDIDL